MFCYKCGCQIADNARFCPNCGASQDATNTLVQSESKDLDREAIQIYLSNILGLECIKIKLDNDYAVFSKQLKYEEDNNYIQNFKFGSGYIWLLYNGVFQVGVFRENDSILAYTGEFLNREQMREGNGFVDYVYGQRIVEHRGTFCWGIIDDKSLPIMKDPSFWSDVGGSNFISQKLLRSNARDVFLEVYSRFKNTAPPKYEKRLKEVVVPLRNKVQGVSDEWKKANELLQEAYSINIIPQQYRNIHAIWFIHDFIKTSNESLTTALLHCNLDEIKQKLDTIIYQQKEIIINQAIMMAQNDKLIEQNQSSLSKLASIEQNTERATKYAEIASNNAEACAWINLANYIKS